MFQKLKLMLVFAVPASAVHRIRFASAEQAKDFLARKEKLDQGHQAFEEFLDHTDWGVDTGPFEKVEEKVLQGRRGPSETIERGQLFGKIRPILAKDATVEVLYQKIIQVVTFSILFHSQLLILNNYSRPEVRAVFEGSKDPAEQPGTTEPKKKTTKDKKTPEQTENIKKTIDDETKKLEGALPEKSKEHLAGFKEALLAEYVGDRPGAVGIFWEQHQTAYWESVAAANGLGAKTAAKKGSATRGAGACDMLALAGFFVVFF